MKRVLTVFGAALCLVGFAAEGVAMVAEPTRLVMWRRGETIGGEEFVAATEEIVDYLATLQRPTEPLKGLRYNCMAKVRQIAPSVQYIGGSPSNRPTGNVYVTTVYELRDCKPL